ncbi:hypothetical protein JOF56_010857 [Kibdelosporangium banguiense]|uniref:PQQ-like domain-containing protein n=1 Tax=Kibdelosporangium banguiense TaxID=1365924 RepID=A0ABS4U1E6_9PSEU|nr:hypothetical protein [Kibdelosporangium banguiense]MBP2330472.1 hypothetical protein [Kibdelosporangium banguiense]
MGVKLVAALAGGLMLVAGSSAAGSGRPPLQRQDFTLIGASSDGAIVLDIRSDTLIGVDRSGKQVWTDRRALAIHADARCMARCPDAVFSGVGPVDSQDPEPWTSDGEPLRLTATPVRRVLTAKSPTDAVVVEGDSRRSWMRLVRPGMPEEKIPLSNNRLRWFENADRTEAVAFSGAREDTAATLMRARHDETGWHIVESKTPRGQAWGACVTGKAVALVGLEPALILDGGQRIPLRTDLSSAGECAFGEAGGAVVERSVDQNHARTTSVRGVALSGEQTWSKRVSGEAIVTAHPSGTTFALASQGKLEIVDAAGKTTGAQDDVAAARFTAAGELVTVSGEGRVRWR